MRLHISHRLRIVVFGDKGVGNTSLLSHTSCNLDEVHKYGTPYCFSILRRGERISLEMYDTPSEEEILSLPLDNKKVDMFFICFSVDNMESLENVTEKWLPEVNKYTNKFQSALIACKTDLRSDTKIKTISREEGMAAAVSLGLTYCEASLLEAERHEDCILPALDPVINTEEWIRRRNRKKRENGCFLCLLVCTCCCLVPICCIHDKIKS